MLPAGVAPETARSLVFVASTEDLLERTRGLFSLLVSTCEGSRFQASKLMSVDRRTMDELRSVPTLRMVDRMGAALGLKAGEAAEVLASARRPDASPAQTRAAIVAADLADDAVVLDRLAAMLQRRPEHPADLGLAQLVRARAAVARGDMAAVSRAIPLALDLGFAHGDGALVRALAEAVHYEALFATPWHAPREADRGLAWILELGRSVDHGGARCEGAAIRHAAWLRADELIRPGACTRSPVARLEELIHASATSTQLAWTASIAALAAMRASLRAPEREQGRLLALIVRAELALDEAHAHEPHPLLLVRRTRVALAEWITRATRGEVDEQTIDDLDEEELSRAAMWFPEARMPWSPRPVGAAKSQLNQEKSHV